MSTVGGYLYNKLTTSTSIAAFSTSVFPDKIESYIIPGIAYSILSEANKRLIARRPIVSIKCFHTTQDLCESFNNSIYKLFDSSTTQQRELYGDMRIESIGIVSNISSQWDDINKVWFGVTDISILYLR